jgi:hypothetical protein
MTDNERKNRGSFLRERIPASDVFLLAALFRYFRTQPHEKKEMNPQEAFIFEAALSYYEETP